jgi:hypothetical protein
MWLRALSDTLRETETESPAPKKNGHGGARAGAGGARPGAGRPRKAKPAVAAVPEQAVAAVPEQLDLVERIDELKRAESAERPESERDRLKAIAIDRGVVWVREILAEKGAAKLSELTDQQVQELLDA